MTRKVIDTAMLQESNRFGPIRENYFVLCDDGTAYQWQKFEDAPVWSLKGRWEGSEFKTHKGRLPRSVEAHMTGFTHRFGGEFAA